MIKRLFYLVFFISILSSCETQDNGKISGEEKEKALSSFIKTFEGTIDDQYEIIIKISSDSGKITGNYFYTDVGQELELLGEIGYDGNLILNEFDEIGNQTGRFEGNLKNGKMVGKWSKPNGNKILPFVLIESSTSYSSVKTEFIELKKIIGKYESPIDPNGGTSGLIIISPIKGRTYGFEILVANAEGCTGNIKGTVKIDRNKIGLYRSKQCEELSLEFSHREVRIYEKKCDLLHGMACRFDGTYFKTN